MGAAMAPPAAVTDDAEPALVAMPCRHHAIAAADDAAALLLLDACPAAAAIVKGVVWSMGVQIDGKLKDLEAPGASMLATLPVNDTGSSA